MSIHFTGVTSGIPLQYEFRLRQIAKQANLKANTSEIARPFEATLHFSEMEDALVFIARGDLRLTTAVDMEVYATVGHEPGIFSPCSLYEKRVAVQQDPAPDLDVPEAPLLSFKRKSWRFLPNANDADPTQ